MHMRTSKLGQVPVGFSRVQKVLRLGGLVLLLAGVELLWLGVELALQNVNPLLMLSRCSISTSSIALPCCLRCARM
jgi:hypothetical protein